MVQRHADSLTMLTSSFASMVAGFTNQNILPYIATTFAVASAGVLNYIAYVQVTDSEPNMDREQILLQLEDARRYYLAKALNQSVPQLQEAWNIQPGTNQHLVAFYPVAHTRRVIEHLTHPRRLGYRVKDPLYRFVEGSFSDFNARVYYPSADTINPHWTQGEVIPF